MTKANHLFVLAGYRGSGKTTALNIAMHREGKFPIFPPATMDDFMSVGAGGRGDPKNAGFHRYDDFPKLARAPQDIMGIHYDLVMPIQNQAHAIYLKDASSADRGLHTPKAWTDILRTMLKNGHIEACLRNHFL